MTELSLNVTDRGLQYAGAARIEGPPPHRGPRA